MTKLILLMILAGADATTTLYDNANTTPTASTRLVHQVAWVRAPLATHVDGSTLSTGFCANDTGLTNTSATYTITAENADGGEFRYFDGCGFTYTAGASSTSASFTYRLNEYDGTNSVSYTVTVTVQ